MYIPNASMKYVFFLFLNKIFLILYNCFVLLIFIIPIYHSIFSVVIHNFSISTVNNISIIRLSIFETACL